MKNFYTRRTWLTSHVLNVAALMAWSQQYHVRRPAAGRWPNPRRDPPSRAADQAAQVATQAERLDLAPWQALAQQAVDAARTAGAHYADARLTRVVWHCYGFGSPSYFLFGSDMVGVGVRALVGGYWGFSANTFCAPTDVVRLARDTVAQAQENAKGTSRAVDLGAVPVATGTWATPIRIDPFTVPIEEKLALMDYWYEEAIKAETPFQFNGAPSWIMNVRQERVVATSEGALFTQTCFEDGGEVLVDVQVGDKLLTGAADGLQVAGKGWEMYLEAKVPAQFLRMKEKLRKKQLQDGTSKPIVVGRYSLVCDGATMASLVAATLGVATQLDRALGYEANASGTSFLDDPLAMVGQFQVAAPVVTVTANRSAPAELATIKWDDEGVTPADCTLVKDGVLTDFQTTREQATWLAPYYHAHGREVRSNGCAAAESAHLITMQHMPNLSLEPSPSAIRLEDLVADVKDGILIAGGAAESDFQGRTGLLWGEMHEIKNGRVGRRLNSGAVRFNTQEFWKKVQAVGGPATQMVQSASQYSFPGTGKAPRELIKGQPPQRTSQSVRAVAAVIPNQTIIDPARKA